MTLPRSWIANYQHIINYHNYQLWIAKICQDLPSLLHWPNWLPYPSTAEPNLARGRDGFHVEKVVLLDRLKHPKHAKTCRFSGEKWWRPPRNSTRCRFSEKWWTCSNNHKKGGETKTTHRIEVTKRKGRQQASQEVGPPVTNCRSGFFCLME